MRLLHTSDWHLGRTLHGVDLLDHQSAYLDHLVDVVRTERVDAVVVAGDVYDRAIPPVEAVTLLSDTLARLAEHTTVVVTSGNHDSATRLGFGSALMRERVRLRTRVASLAEPVEVGGALVYGLPYLDPDVCRAELAPVGEDGTRTLLARSHEAVTRAAMARVRADVDARRGGARPRVVVAAHAFVVGGRASESERDIRVGGVDHVPADVFAGTDYVALGHLHGPQVVNGPAGTVLRYSGSPLAYSFSEQHQAKSSVLVDLSGDEPQVTTLPAPVPRRLADVTGTLDDLLGAAGEPHVDDWVRVTVTDPARPADLFRRVRQRFAHALVVQHHPDRPDTGATRPALVTAAADPVEVAADFVAHVTGALPTAAERRVLRDAYEHVAGAERSA
ncbi:exonuclease SbcCD subunit D [Cellulomonas wangsupingiae]|uniref:Nuclease SbcCD subunit D n=1 Tax=Cellulomonas wangsupingiae TaxID=2968085 RepID=A0ABY5K664_9CELL|nr:exonuclease SbcCD subunit D C-terminal domain-containing protein [Cellulomonas wangsupingiae]MCC2334024.1 exonuclease SbcCD subunit D C-terminal domain-containing protein [Cellulomonas wangsupingiae]UUI65274.1 exonuclease SbcCD subunit D C-terminal domain-containing protein [Cellulomonas wangsupingiae]